MRKLTLTNHVQSDTTVLENEFIDSLYGRGERGIREGIPYSFAPSERAFRNSDNFKDCRFIRYYRKRCDPLH